jgi:hypothetical protein
MDNQELLSRAQLGDLAQVDDDALGFWMSKNVLENKAEGLRKHRRFTRSEAKIAAVLGEARAYGANISTLRDIALLLRRGQRVFEADDRSLEDVFDDPRDKYVRDYQVGLSLHDCDSVLLLFRKEQDWCAEVAPGMNSLPARSGMVFDLEKVLARFRVAE